jgi:hypothetical protein
MFRIDFYKNALFRNLLLILSILLIFFICLLMILAITNTINNQNKTVIVDNIDGKYLKIESKDDLYPELKIKGKTEAKVTRSVSDNELKVVFIGVINNLENYKVIECGKLVTNCNNTLILKLNKTPIKPVISGIYIIKANIASNLQITLLSIEPE